MTVAKTFSENKTNVMFTNMGVIQMSNDVLPTYFSCTH